MKLSLIAMSGSGKSYWSAKLAEHGFWRFDCDRMIAQQLHPTLRRSDGSVRSLGEWMGFPYQPGFRQRESTYLRYEKKVLQQIFDTIESKRADATCNIVVDTTGSIVYTGKKILDQLRRITTVVYLEVPFVENNQMYRAYRADPRPVLWQGKFVKKPGEKNEDTLARCYPELLSERQRLYNQYAHVTVEYDQHRKKGWEVADFLDAVKMGLQR